MKKLLSVIACFSICLSIQAQIQIENGETRQQNADEHRSAGVRIVPVQQTTEQKAVEVKKEEAVPHQHKADCPKAATCPKAAAAANGQDDAKKPCCAKHQENKADADATKTGCSHQQSTDHKCNHGSGEKPACQKKTEEGKK